MPAENQQFIDPREIERPFSQEFAFGRRPDTLRFDSPALVVDHLFALIPTKVGYAFEKTNTLGSVTVRITADRSTKIVREKALETEQTERKPQEIKTGLGTVVLTLRSNEPNAFVANDYKITFAKEKSQGLSIVLIVSAPRAFSSLEVPDLSPLEPYINSPTT